MATTTASNEGVSVWSPGARDVEANLASVFKEEGKDRAVREAARATARRVEMLGRCYALLRVALQDLIEGKVRVVCGFELKRTPRRGGQAQDIFLYSKQWSDFIYLKSERSSCIWMARTSGPCRKTTCAWGMYAYGYVTRGRANPAATNTKDHIPSLYRWQYGVVDNDLPVVLFVHAL